MLVTGLTTTGFENDALNGVRVLEFEGSEEASPAGDGVLDQFDSHHDTEENEEHL